MKINSSKEVLNHLKQGEINSIINNSKATKDKKIRIVRNSIFLASNSHVLLRTNGAVIYGQYDTTGKGNFNKDNAANLVSFTHDINKYKVPFVSTRDYAKMKTIVLNAWKNIWDNVALMKYLSVIYVLTHANEFETEIKEDNKEIKKEVKNMNTNTRSHVMALAHKIRKEDKLEGDYSAQMSIALRIAWTIVRAVKPLEDTFNSVNESLAAPVMEEEKIEAVKEDITALKESTNEAEKEVSVSLLEPSKTNCVYMTKTDSEIQLIFESKSGKKSVIKSYSAPTLSIAEGLMFKKISSLLRTIPKDSTIYIRKNYADKSRHMKELLSIMKEKNIKIVDRDKAPSGIAV